MKKKKKKKNLFVFSKKKKKKKSFWFNPSYLVASPYSKSKIGEVKDHGFALGSLKLCGIFMYQSMVTMWHNNKILSNTY